MVGTSGSWLYQQQSLWDSFPSKNCMIAPVEHRQHEFLPVSVNPFKASTANLGFNGFGKPIAHYPSQIVTPNGYLEEQTSLLPTKVDAQTSTYEAPSTQQKKFVIFDRCGHETRLVFSSLRPQVENQHQFLANKVEHEDACTKTPVHNEESGENETVDEGSEMHEDTEEINALLYSDDDTDEDDDEDDDEASTGHSPLAKWEEQDFDEVASTDSTSKRQKALDGGCNRNGLHQNTHGGDSMCSYDVGCIPTIGNKRPRNDNIRDTLRVLKSIIPDLNSKDPIIILDEAINYLKSLKSNAQTISLKEDPDSSTSYGPSS